MKLIVTAWGWMLRLDCYGIALHATDRFAADMAATHDDDGHDCDRQHPDGPCPADEGGFSEDDLAELLHRVWNRLIDPPAAMAEFVAGVRAEPQEGDA